MKPSKLSRFILPITLVLLVFTSINVLAQQQKNSAEALDKTTTALYTDVWLPFMQSYRALDVDTFMSVHANDLTRVLIDQNKIQNRPEYVTQMTGVFSQLKGAGQQIDIKFSILSTATDGDKAYQTGYYCFSMRASNQEEFTPRGYGFFNVFLTKEDGLWKIATDADKQAVLSYDEFEKAGTVYRLN